MTTDAVTSSARDCRWWCNLCRHCHANACSPLWGGNPEVPCGHSGPYANLVTPTGRAAVADTQEATDA